MLNDPLHNEICKEVGKQIDVPPYKIKHIIQEQCAYIKKGIESDSFEIYMLAKFGKFIPSMKKIRFLESLKNGKNRRKSKFNNG